MVFGGNGAVGGFHLHLDEDDDCSNTRSDYELHGLCHNTSLGEVLLDSDDQLGYHDDCRHDNSNNDELLRSHSP